MKTEVRHLQTMSTKKLPIVSIKSLTVRDSHVSQSEAMCLPNACNRDNWITETSEIKGLPRYPIASSLCNSRAFIVFILCLSCARVVSSLQNQRKQKTSSPLAGLGYYRTGDMRGTSPFPLLPFVMPDLSPSSSYSTACSRYVVGSGYAREHNKSSRSRAP